MKSCNRRSTTAMAAWGLLSFFAFCLNPVSAAWWKDTAGEGLCLSEHNTCFSTTSHSCSTDGHCGDCCEGLVCGGTSFDTDKWKACRRPANSCSAQYKECFAERDTQGECCTGLVCGGKEYNNGYKQCVTVDAPEEVSSIVTAYDSLVTDWEAERSNIVDATSFDSSESIQAMIAEFEALKSACSAGGEVEGESYDDVEGEVEGGDRELEEASIEDCIMLNEKFNALEKDFIYVAAQVKANNVKLMEKDMSKLVTKKIQGIQALAEIASAKEEAINAIDTTNEDSLLAGSQILASIENEEQKLQNATTTVTELLHSDQSEHTSTVCFDIQGASDFLPMGDEAVLDKVTQFAKEAIQNAMAADGEIPDVLSAGLTEQNFLPVESSARNLRGNGDDRNLRSSSHLQVQFVYQYRCLCGSDNLVSDVHRERKLQTTIESPEDIANLELGETFRTAWNNGVSDMMAALGARTAIGGVLSAVTKIQAVPCSSLNTV